MIEELKSLISEYENDIKCIQIEALTKAKIMTRKKNKLQDLLIIAQKTAHNSDYAKCPSGKMCKNWSSKCGYCVRNDNLTDNFAER